MNPMIVEKKEFWGVTGPSILACLGMLTSIGGSWLCLKHPVGIAVGILGLIMIGLALRANLTKGLNVKWRRTNFIMHVVMFVLSLVVLLCMLGFLRHINVTS